MNEHIIIKDWLALDGDTKNRLREKFAIPKSEAVQVANDAEGSHVVCDGTTFKDLERLGVGHMIKFLGDELPWYSEDLCEKLLDLTIKKLYGRERSYWAGEKSAEPRRAGRPRKASGSVPDVA